MSPTGAEPVLSVRHLSAHYRTEEDTVRAVRDVSFDLYPGEVLALVGESAAGKSSVAHLVLGLIPPNARVDGGDIQFRGRSLLSMPTEELRRVRGAEISMIFQDALSALTPTLRIGEQLAELFQAHRNMEKGAAEQAAVQVLGAVFPDDERLAELFPFQLSGGMAQRVMMALATALDPSIVIADEPTANLDPAIRMEMLQRLEEMRDHERLAVLLITHDFGVVARLADRVAVMYAGEIVEVASVREVFKRPLHPYTFGLLRSLPDIAGGGRLEMMPGQPPDLARLPPECPFLVRCRKATNECRTSPAPALVVGGDIPDLEGEELEPGHAVACYNPMAVGLRD